jgi:hypothetical protein
MRLRPGPAGGPSWVAGLPHLARTLRGHPRIRIASGRQARSGDLLRMRRIRSRRPNSGRKAVGLAGIRSFGSVMRMRMVLNPTRFHIRIPLIREPPAQA